MSKDSEDGAAAETSIIANQLPPYLGSGASTAVRARGEVWPDERRVVSLGR